MRAGWGRGEGQSGAAGGLDPGELTAARGSSVDRRWPASTTTSGKWVPPRPTSPHPPLCQCGDVEPNPGPWDDDPFSDLDPDDKFDLLSGDHPWQCEGESWGDDFLEEDDLAWSRAPVIPRGGPTNFETECRLLTIALDLLEGMKVEEFRRSITQEDRTDAESLSRLKAFLLEAPDSIDRQAWWSDELEDALRMAMGVEEPEDILATTLTSLRFQSPGNVKSHAKNSRKAGKRVKHRMEAASSTSSADAAVGSRPIGDVRQCGYCNSVFSGGPTDFVAPRSSSPPVVPLLTGASGVRRMPATSAAAAVERSVIGDVRQCGYCISFFPGGPTDFVAPRSPSPSIVPMTSLVAPAPLAFTRSVRHHAPHAGEDAVNATGRLHFTAGGQALEQKEGVIEASAQGESAHHHHPRRRPRGNRGGRRQNPGQAPSGF